MNFLNKKTVNAQISHKQETISVGIIPGGGTDFPKLSPDGTTDLTLSIMLQKKPHEVNLKLTGDQNIIYVVRGIKEILIKDYQTQKVLATLNKNPTQ